MMEKMTKNQMLDRIQDRINNDSIRITDELENIKRMFAENPIYGNTNHMIAEMKRCIDSIENFRNDIKECKLVISALDQIEG